MLHLRSFVARRAPFIGSDIGAMTSTHVERTAGSSRDTVFSRVKVTDICQLSPTVKGYTLKVYNRDLRFLAGQWVDLHIPNEDIIGGYSIFSPPHQLEGEEDSIIKLAIKGNSHPPTLWMTTKCEVGDELTIRIGGDFYYSPDESNGVEDLLLIGGGVGINPLFSILSHHARLLHISPLSVLGKRGSVRLLYSSKTENELLLKDQIEQLSDDNRVRVQYFVTSPSPNGTEKSNLSMKYGRMSTSDVVEALRGLNIEKVRCYLCGPPPMTESMMETLIRHCGILTNQIHYEKWW